MLMVFRATRKLMLWYLQRFLMSHRRATAQNLTEFAQNLEMFTRILKDHALLTGLQFFLPIFTPLRKILGMF